MTFSTTIACENGKFSGRCFFLTACVCTVLVKSKVLSSVLKKYNMDIKLKDPLLLIYFSNLIISVF